MCLDEVEGFELVAACDQHPSAAEGLRDGVRFHDSFETLLDEDLDALFVCMSNDMAAEVTIAGLERGLHVFCEKPPARSLEEYAEVVRAERNHPGLKLMYGFNHRYHESVEDALRIMASGELGEVLSLRGVYGKSQLVTFNQPDWRTKRPVAGGGVLLDQGIHMVDLIRLFGGEFDDVHSYVSNSHWGYDVEDNAYAIMRSASGVVATLTSSATQWRHQFTLEVTMSKGSLIMGGILSSSKSYGSETLTVVRANPFKDSGDPREQMTRYNEDTSWTKEVTAFRDAIVDSGPVFSGNSTDALNTLALVYKIYYADERWRQQYAIPNPRAVVAALDEGE
jgi:predicted dehydrogenase